MRGEWIFISMLDTCLLLQVLFALADPRDFGMSVDDGRDAVVVDVDRTSGDAFHAYDALILRFVGEHGAVDAVTDGVNTANTHFGYITLRCIKLSSEV